MRQLQMILDANSLLPGEAASIAGKLAFAASALFGRVGRAMLVPLYQKGACKSVFCGAGAFAPLGIDLIDAIQWWIHVLSNNIESFEKVLTVDSVPSTRWHLLYTDASQSAIGGVLLEVDGASICSSRYFSVPVPEHLLNLPIHVYEMWAVLCALWIWIIPEQLRTVRMYVDNTGVLGSMIKGHSKCPDLLYDVHRFWLTLVEQRLPAWMDYVQSKSNIADFPSRSLPPFVNPRLGLVHHVRDDVPVDCLPW